MSQAAISTPDSPFDNATHTQLGNDQRGETRLERTIVVYLIGGVLVLTTTIAKHVLGINHLAADIPAGVLSRRALVPMGITSVEHGLSFSPDAALLASEVAAGQAICAFLIPPVDVERVWEHAASGGKMPEKSTYFHPKPRDGIVIRPLEPC